MSDEPRDDEARGTDWVTILYIVGGIPAMVAFFVGLFVLEALFDIPA